MGLTGPDVLIGASLAKAFGAAGRRPVRRRGRGPPLHEAQRNPRALQPALRGEHPPRRPTPWRSTILAATLYGFAWPALSGGSAPASPRADSPPRVASSPCSASRSRRGRRTRAVQRLLRRGVRAVLVGASPPQPVRGSAS